MRACKCLASSDCRNILYATACGFQIFLVRGLRVENGLWLIMCCYNVMPKLNSDCMGINGCLNFEKIKQNGSYSNQRNAVVLLYHVPGY